MSINQIGGKYFSAIAASSNNLLGRISKRHIHLSICAQFQTI